MSQSSSIVPPSENTSTTADLYHDLVQLLEDSCVYTCVSMVDGKVNYDRSVSNMRDMLNRSNETHRDCKNVCTWLERVWFTKLPVFWWWRLQKEIRRLLVIAMFYENYKRGGSPDPKTIPPYLLYLHDTLREFSVPNGPFDQFQQIHEKNIASNMDWVNGYAKLDFSGMMK